MSKWKLLWDQNMLNMVESMVFCVCDKEGLYSGRLWYIQQSGLRQIE